MTARALVMAKAPVPGRVKTRLGAVIGMDEAAAIAAAALLDTLEACRFAFGHDCAIALDGDLDDAVAGAEIAAALKGWQVFAQVGDTFGERLVHAHQVASVPGSIVVQIGMDTPQVTASLLRDAAAAVAGPADVALGSAEDGGWWVLALANPDHAQVLADVPMSDPATYSATVAALLGAGAQVKVLPAVCDVDTAADADRVAALAPETRFASAWTSRSAVAS
jgi:glycosyltransferase A (GT-A) superfamily protein (DUF2064 family)